MKYIKKNWDAALAFLFIWMAPLIFLFIQGICYFKTNNSFELKFELAAVLVLGILLIIYFKKIRKWLNNKILASDIKGVPKSPLIVLINGISTCACVFLLYLVVMLLETFCSNVGSYLKIILVFEAVGALFNFIHALRKVGE